MLPALRALCLHEFLDTDSSFNTFFSQVGGGSSFSINGLGLGRDWALVGAGLNFELGSGGSTYANYDVMVNGQTTFHIGSGSVMYHW